MTKLCLSSGGFKFQVRSGGAGSGLDCEQWDYYNIILKHHFTTALETKHKKEMNFGQAMTSKP